jgi:ABC-2 type transport system permease protein
MTGTAGALAFLIARTTRNRIARQLARLKSPRYAIAAIVGLLYFWLVFARPGAVGRNPGTVGTSPVLGTVGGIGFAITVLVWWLRGGVTGALAFQPAEVQLLFPAPVSRRTLIGYKVIRSQLLLLLSGLIWTLLTRRWGVTLSAPLRFATIWGFFSVLSLHRLGTALVMTQPLTGGRRAALYAGRTLAAAAAFGLLAGVGPVVLRLRSLGFEEGFRALGAALATPPAAWALAPFRLMLAPLYAPSLAAWVPAFAIVLGVILLHLVWVLSLNVAFEEVAATASADMAKRISAFRERRAGGAAVIRPGKVVRSWLPLAPLGRPAIAIVWKNTVALIRTGILRAALMVVLVLVAMSGVMMRAADNGGPATAIPFLILAGMAFVLGPRMVRNDLRQDLLSLASIKTYPLSGAMVVLAEMASPTLVLSVFQFVMLTMAYVMLPATYRVVVDLPSTLAIGLVLPFAVLAINAASVGVQNAVALLFPTWVRLGADSGGIEAIGQTLVVTIGSMLVLLLSLVLPVGAAVTIATVLRPSVGGIGVALGAAVGVIALGIEVGFMVGGLGALFERTDPTSIG